MNNRLPSDSTVLLHIVTSLELGGAQLATLYEVAHSRYGDAGRFLAFGPGGLLDPQAYALSHVTCFPIPSLVRHVSLKNDAEAIFALAKLVASLKRRFHPAKVIVHTHSSKAGIVGRLAAFLGKADLIVHSIHGFAHSHHGSRLEKQLFLMAERMAAQCTNGFTADSLANLVEGVRAGILCRHKRAVVRCGISLEDYGVSPKNRLTVRAELNIAPDAPIILSVACLKPQKDHKTLLEVAQKVVTQYPQAVFLLAGDGELRDELTRHIEKHNLEKHVRLLGWRRDIPDLMHASDILLLTSRWEGLPQTLPQAMCAGLPIVCTDVDGNKEAVIHGETGLLCQAKDSVGLSEAVLSLLSNPTLRAHFIKHGKKRAPLFSNARMVQHLDAFYDVLCENAP